MAVKQASGDETDSENSLFEDSVADGDAVLVLCLLQDPNDRLDKRGKLKDICQKIPHDARPVT